MLGVGLVCSSHVLLASARESGPAWSSDRRRQTVSGLLIRWHNFADTGGIRVRRSRLSTGFNLFFVLLLEFGARPACLRGWIEDISFSPWSAEGRHSYFKTDARIRDFLSCVGLEHRLRRSSAGRRRVLMGFEHGIERRVINLFSSSFVAEVISLLCFVIKPDDEVLQHREDCGGD